MKAVNQTMKAINQTDRTVHDDHDHDDHDHDDRMVLAREFPMPHSCAFFALHLHFLPSSPSFVCKFDCSDNTVLFSILDFLSFRVKQPR